MPRDRHARHAVAKVLGLVGRNRIEEKIMGVIMINCPATGHGVSTGIEVCATDQLPVVTAKMVCPACGRVHEWTKKEAWLANGGGQYGGAPYRKGAGGWEARREELWGEGKQSGTHY